MAEERLFKSMYEFVQGAYDCDPEVFAEELSQLTKVERENIAAAEYVEAGSYPAGKFLRSNMKLAMRLGRKLYYPIVGWNPDAASPVVEGIKIPVMRKYLNRLPKRYLHNPRENKTYILYG